VKRAQGGFSLVEVLVAITLLSVVLLGVSRLTFVMARRFYSLSGGAARGASSLSR